jgi:hypothetical protein
MAAIDTPNVLTGAGRVLAQGKGETAFVTETWQNLMVMLFEPGRTRVKQHARAMPDGYVYTGKAALWMGTLARAWMHRGGDVHAWTSHPLAGKPVAWIEAQVLGPGGAIAYAGVTGWAGEGVILDLVPEGIRLARETGQLSFDHNKGTGVLTGRIETNGPAMAYRVAADGFEQGPCRAPQGLWDGARITGSFSYASAGRVKVSPGPGRALWLDRLSDAVIGQACGEGPLKDLIHPSALTDVCLRPGETNITRCAPECLSGEACATRWSLSEPG